MTGSQLLELCGGFEPSAPAGEACERYFRDTLGQLLNTWRGRRSACPPPGFGPSEAIALYRSEARRFPEVLGTPAGRLVEGMLLKFHPCTGT